MYMTCVPNQITRKYIAPIHVQFFRQLDPLQIRRLPLRNPNHVPHCIPNPMILYPILTL